MTQHRPSSKTGRTHPVLEPILVDTPSKLEGLHHTLSRNLRRLAVDTESNSLYVYKEQVCLIQLSTDRADYLIDPLAFDNGGHALTFLGAIFANPAIEKVFHAAEYDVMCLHRDFGFEMKNVFDTMISARLLGWKKFGLGAILKRRFGVIVDKRHQRANWGRRPLPEKLIHYAQLDTHYLLLLRDELHELLERRGYLYEARELFNEVCEVRWNGSGFDPNGFWQLKGARDLASDALGPLRELYLYRETQAKRRNLPVFKILGDHVLVQLAARRPTTLEDLASIPGLGKSHVRYHGTEILKAVRRGMVVKLSAEPHRRRTPANEDDLRRFEALLSWRKYRAMRRGIPSDIVMSKDTLWTLAQNPPRTPAQLDALKCLGPWRLKTYGSEILDVLARVDGR